MHFESAPCKVSEMRPLTEVVCKRREGQGLGLSEGGRINRCWGPWRRKRWGLKLQLLWWFPLFFLRSSIRLEGCSVSSNHEEEVFRNVEVLAWDHWGCRWEHRVVQSVTVDLELDHQRLYSPLPMLMVYQENPKRQSQERSHRGLLLNKNFRIITLQMNSLNKRSRLSKRHYKQRSLNTLIRANDWRQVRNMKTKYNQSVISSRWVGRTKYGRLRVTSSWSLWQCSLSPSAGRRASWHQSL